MLRNVGWGLAGMGLPLVVGVMAIPFLLQNLGVELMGILTLVWALVGYFSLFDFGLGRALTQQISVSLANKNLKDVPGLAKNGLSFTLATGIAGGLLLAMLADPLSFKWLGISQALQQDVAWSLLIASLGIPLTTATTGLRGVLEAYGEFRTVNLLRMILGLTSFGLPVLCIFLVGPSLSWIITSLIGARFVVLVAHLVFVNRQLPPSWHAMPVSEFQLRRLSSFGAWLTVSNVVSPLMVNADRFVISMVLGAEMVAYYTLPSEMLMRLLILPSALTAVLFPQLAAMFDTDRTKAVNLYRKCLGLTALVMTPVCLVTALLSHWGLTLWLGADFADHSWRIVVCLAAGVWVNSLAFVPFAAIQAAGQAKVTAKIHLAELLLYVPLLFWSLSTFGLIGAALIGVARVSVDMIAMFWAASRLGYR